MEEVARQANYEGNHSLLLFERVSNPKIREQIIDMLMLDEKDREKKKHRKVVRDEKGKPVLDSSGKPKYRPAEYVAKTRNQVEDKFQKNLEKVRIETPVSFEGKGPDTGHIPAGLTVGGEKVTVVQMSAVEAHEKGHILRTYGGETVYKIFGRVLDLSAITWSDEYIAGIRKKMGGIPPGTTDEAIIERSYSYFLSPMEIAERMSQLKNYFGMNGAEKFTVAHLTYAREHYIKDTGNDNGMTQFFQAITPETEKEFLRLINSAGI